MCEVGQQKAQTIGRCCRVLGMASHRKAYGHHMVQAEDNYTI